MKFGGVVENTRRLPDCSKNDNVYDTNRGFTTSNYLISCESWFRFVFLVISTQLIVIKINNVLLRPSSDIGRCTQNHKRTQIEKRVADTGQLPVYNRINLVRERPIFFDLNDKVVCPQIVVKKSVDAS